MFDKALIVDNDVNTVNTLSEFLGGGGYEVFIASCYEALVSFISSICCVDILFLNAEVVEPQLENIVNIFKHHSPKTKVVLVVEQYTPSPTYKHLYFHYLVERSQVPICFK